MSRCHRSDQPGLTEFVRYYLARRRGDRTLRRAHRCVNGRRVETPEPAAALPEIRVVAGKHRPT